MAVQNIENLDELLKDIIGSNEKIINHEIVRLTAIGENYGSLMLAVKITVQNGVKTEIIEAVAKLPPPGEFMQKMFNTPITFRNEINFYKIIIPELRKFLMESGNENLLDCFPKILGARLSMKDPESDVADDGAALVLENLKILGYEVVDRTVGFDLKTTKLILKNLAKFHAVSLAFKILKPEEFNKKIKSLFTPFRVFDLDENASQAFIEKNMKIVDEIDDIREFSERVRAAFDKSFLMEPKNSLNFRREPFATIIHTDLWVNNVMVKFIDSEPVNTKIVDFQLYEYGSPARDLMFFIYTSIQIPVLENHYDEFIQTYHGTFIETLEKLGCNTEPFSMEKFQEEIQLSMEKIIFLQCMVMFQPIYATKENLKELDQCSEEDMTNDIQVSNKHKEKVAFVIKDCITRKFI